MILLLSLAIGWALAASWWAWKCEQALKRAYRYAVERADFTERGSAYSDMATVIVLAREEEPSAARAR